MFGNIVRATGRQLIESELRIVQGRHQMDLERLAEQVAPDTRMVLLCSPHNPGGRVWSAAELRDLAALLHRARPDPGLGRDPPRPGLRGRHAPRHGQGGARGDGPAGDAGGAVQDLQHRRRAGRLHHHLDPGCVAGCTMSARRPGSARRTGWVPSWRRRPMRTAPAGSTRCCPTCSGTATCWATHWPGASRACGRWRWNRPISPGWISRRSACRRTSSSDARSSGPSVVPHKGSIFGAGGEGWLRFNFALPRPVLERAIDGLAEAFAG